MALKLMRIGQLAQKAGVSPRAIRHYEHLGLVEVPVRTAANYRLFDDDAAARIEFISRCRGLGFSIAEITDLLRIVDDPEHTCAQVAELSRHHLDLIDAKIQSLTHMRGVLAKWLSHCTEGNIGDCAILDFLENRS